LSLKVPAIELGLSEMGQGMWAIIIRSDEVQTRHQRLQMAGPNRCKLSDIS
jgi:hypothetical protein